MKFLKRSKDGGPESTVDAYWLFEIKGLGSVALLRFGAGSRSAYHSHAFHSLNWQLSGRTRETQLDAKTGAKTTVTRRPSLLPIVTLRRTLHRVVSEGTSWVLAVRGPWQKLWVEYHPDEDEFDVLADGRRVVDCLNASSANRTWIDQLLRMKPRAVAEAAAEVL